jgi:hypothetical protein
MNTLNVTIKYTEKTFCDDWYVGNDLLCDGDSRDENCSYKFPKSEF